MVTAQAAELLRRRSPAWRASAHAELVEGAQVGRHFPPGFVRRPELVSRLTSARNASLALIVAPPGYGKSTLLSDWAEHDERAFIWLGLQLGEAGIEAPLLASAIDGAGQCAGAYVVVLDDAHLVAPDSLRGLLEAVLAVLDDGSMVALASRTELQLPVGRLRAHRALVEVRINDLAMSRAESAAVLRQAGLHPDAAALQSLLQRTEGWPAAVYLAGLSLSEHPDPPVGLAGFRGDDHLLSEYLRDEVLSVLPAHMMSFLLRTSILDQLSGPACDAVLAQRGSALMLAALARESPLLEPLNRAHDVYRWHPLFRDALAAELRRREPGLSSVLHRRASRFFREHGDTDRAIDHACAARDARLTGDLIWASIAGYLARGGIDRVGRWLSSFGEDEIAAHGPLALCAAHHSLVLGNAEEAQHWASIAGAALEEDQTGPRARSLAVGIGLIVATIARGGAAAMRQAAQRAYELEPDGGPWRPALSCLMGVAEHLAGNREAAVRLLDDCVERGGGAAPWAMVVALAQRAVIAIEQADWELAEELTDQAERVIADRGLTEAPVVAVAFATSAAARAHQGRADEAKQDLRRGIDLLVVLGDVIAWYGAETRILLAHASLWLADVVGARTLLAQASRLARRTPDAVVFEHWFDRAWSHMDTLAETSLAGPSSLTIAELRVLRFLPSHRSFREIAAQLGVSANTIKTQAHAVYRKLGVASRSEAVARAHEAGLLGK